MRFHQEEVDRLCQLDQIREREAQRKKRQAHLNAKQEQEERENLILEELKRNKAIQEAEINMRFKDESKILLVLLLLYQQTSATKKPVTSKDPGDPDDNDS